MDKYKVQLQYFQYPNINAFKDEEIQELFLEKNRCLLLTWLVNNLNPEVTFPMECSKLTEITIADYLYETGFCTLSQKLSFVQCTCSLDEDIKIFDRIFHYLHQIQEDVSVDSFEKNSYGASVDDFLSKDINIFPVLQTLRVCTEEERNYKLAKYKENIEELKKLTNRNSDTGNGFNMNDSIFEDSIISSNTESFKKHIQNLSKNTLVIKNIKPLQTENGFRKNFTSQLKMGCNKIRPVVQYFKSMNLMKYIADNLNDNTSTTQDHEVLEVVKRCAENFEQIVKSLES